MLTKDLCFKTFSLLGNISGRLNFGTTTKLKLSLSCHHFCSFPSFLLPLNLTTFFLSLSSLSSQASFACLLVTFFHLHNDLCSVQALAAIPSHFLSLISPSYTILCLDPESSMRLKWPVDEKILLGSDNVHTPVRYGTSFNHSTGKVHYWRDFVKHYSHPLSKWIDLWPSNPPCYKEKVGKYAEATHVLHKQLLEAISESLGLEKNYLQEEIEEGSQVMAVNCYPACPEPDIALGMPPHSDFSSLTILLQSSQGLQIMDCNNNWVSVPYIEGALIVQLGDQVEVMSNGIYKSVVHRVTVNKDFKRLSFASLHSLPLHQYIVFPLLDHQTKVTLFSFVIGLKMSRNRH